MTTLDKVKEIIVDQLGVDPADVTDDAQLIDDIGADSFDIVELVMTLEEDFDIEIPDEVSEKFNDMPIVDIAKYIDASK